MHRRRSGRSSRRSGRSSGRTRLLCRCGDRLCSPSTLSKRWSTSSKRRSDFAPQVVEPLVGPTLPHRLHDPRIGETYCLHARRMWRICKFCDASYLHEHQAESVVALGTDRLDRRRLDPRLGGEHLVEAALSAIAGSSSDSSTSAPSRITLSATISPPGPGPLQRPGEVLGRVRLVGVDEDEVEGPGVLLLQPRQRLECRADPQVDQLGQSGALDAARATSACLGIRLQGASAPALGQGPGQPDRAVAAQGAEFEHPAAPRSPSPAGRAASPAAGVTWIAGSPASVGRGHRRLERLVIRRQQPAHILVDRRPRLSPPAMT